jgi:methionyl-tRNA synthetase
VPVPGYEEKVIYVWFEAVIGYLSASKEWAKSIGRPDAWKEFWTDPEVRSYYFLGKDNIPFHTIIWPAILLGYGGLNLPYDVPANEWLTFKGEKFSKSRGVGVDVPSFLKKFDSDLVRYYLTVNMPEGKDADFSWEDFDAKINNELVATLGNYYHRVLSFTQKNFGSIPVLPMLGTEKERQEVYDAIVSCKVDVETYLSTCQFKKALKSVMDLAQFGNRFFDAVAPWALVKSDKPRCGAMLHLNLEIVKALSVMSYPFLPRSANEVWDMMGQKGAIGMGSWTQIDATLSVGQELKSPRPAFNKIVAEKEVSPFAEFSKLNLKVARVLDVNDHPNADKLFVLKLDAGREVQLVAGLKGYYSREQLLGKRIVYISNLQPAKLRGVESQGMMLAAEMDGKVFALTPGDGAEPGEAVDSGLPQGEKSLSFQDFQKFIIRTGHVTAEDEVDIGRPVKVKFPANVNVPSQVAVFLPTPDAKEGLPLFTAKGVLVTVDGELGNGAQVR